jgi:Lrp/AsnC family leucine-responsive transcriptional regulator
LNGETLDELNWRILVELQRDGRLSHAELGRRVGLSQPAVAERVRRLEESGVIEGYHAAIDLAKAGRPVSAVIRIATRTGQPAVLTALIRDLPDVLECHRITGDDCYTLKIAVASVGDLQALIDRLVPYGHPTTSIILSSPVTHRIVEAVEEEDANRPQRRIISSQAS